MCWFLFVGQECIILLHYLRRDSSEPGKANKRLNNTYLAYLSWHVGSCWQKEQIIDAVDNILRRDVLFTLFDLGNWSVNAYVSDSFAWIIIILKDKVATKWKNQILQNVDRCLSAEHEFAIL